VRAYPNEHKTWLTVEKLSRMLSEAGFDARPSAHGQSRSPLMRDINYFDFRHPRISLYVEAIKPDET
jgi:hypothetical protein